MSLFKPGEHIPNREFTGNVKLFAVALAVLTSLVHCWMNSIGLIMTIKMNAIHLATMMALVFLYFPARAKSRQDAPSAIDWMCVGLALLGGLYIIVSYDRILADRLEVNQMDLIISVMTMALLVEASRRAVGMPLTVLCVFFLVYTKYGPYFPGLFSHRGFDWARVITRMALTDQGIYGVTIMVSSSYVFMFILFGAFLAATKTSEFFNDFALAIAGKYRGGPAKVAVVASALMGSISGSSQANVATTGAFTIPLMIKVGYKPFFAGAVEAAASTGGILMPPIMGASAFIMSTFLGIPYVTIMLAGIFPALLYYGAIMTMVDPRTSAANMQSINAAQSFPPANIIMFMAMT